MSGESTLVTPSCPLREIFGQAIADAVASVLPGAANAIVRLLDTDYTGNIILGSGIMTPVARVVEILREISGCEIRDLDAPTSGPQRFQCDTSTLERLTGWKPEFSIESGIRNTYDRMREWKAAGRMAEVAA